MIVCDICGTEDDDGIELELHTPKSPTRYTAIWRLCAGHAANVLKKTVDRALDKRLDQMVADAVGEAKEAYDDVHGAGPGG